MSTLTLARQTLRAVSPRHASASAPVASIRRASTSAPAASSSTEPLTHYRITLRRSAISLPDKVQGTVAALGLRRRHQTVYHIHSPECAGKILKIKELVEVENVPVSAVKTQEEQRAERKAPRGYEVEGSSLAQGMF